MDRPWGFAWGSRQAVVALGASIPMLRGVRRLLPVFSSYLGVKTLCEIRDGVCEFGVVAG